MKDSEIKRIVISTIRELKREEMLRKDPDEIYESMGRELRKYYRKPSDDNLREALRKMEDEPYLPIIPMFYRDGKTITAIAISMGCDRTTVIRNKKKLVLKLYEMYCKN